MDTRSMLSDEPDIHQTPVIEESHQVCCRVSPLAVPGSLLSMHGVSYLEITWRLM